MTERLDRATTCNVKKAMLMHLHYFLIVYAWFLKKNKFSPDFNSISEKKTYIRIFENIQVLSFNELKHRMEYLVIRLKIGDLALALSILFGLICFSSEQFHKHIQNIYFLCMVMSAVVLTLYKYWIVQNYKSAITVEETCCPRSEPHCDI